MAPYGFDTRAVHAGRDDLRNLGVHAPPLDLSSTNPIGNLDAATASLAAMAEGRGPVGGEAIYARLHNPTVARFEAALARLEGTEASVGFASGMAALTACLLAARSRGDRVVAIRPLYGGSDHLLASGLLGLGVVWTTADRVASVVDDRTALVILETPANPTLDLVDIADVVRQAGRVPVLVDNTFATPVLQNPARWGASLVLHSATKFLGGHGDVVAGLVACDEAWARRLRQVRVATGGILHPLAGYLLHRGLQTLPLRVRKAQDNAEHLAQRLVADPHVTAVRYPSLPGQDRRGLLGTQMRGPGAILAFDVVGGRAAAAAVLEEVRCLTPAVSLGSVDSLVQHPAGLTHHVVEPEARAASGIGPATLRISTGVEDADDLWDDLRGALARARARVGVAR